MTVGELIAELRQADPRLMVKIVVVDAAAEPYCDAVRRRGAYSIAHRHATRVAPNRRHDVLLLTCAASDV